VKNDETPEKIETKKDSIATALCGPSGSSWVIVVQNIATLRTKTIIASKKFRLISDYIFADFPEKEKLFLRSIEPARFF